jgi:hypothetical protein
VTSIRFLRDRPTATLATALVVSLLAHLVLAALPAPPLATTPAPTLLSATITEIPPPPAPPKAAKPPKHKPRPMSPVLAAPTPEPERAVAATEAEAAPPSEASASEATAPAPSQEARPVAAAEAAPSPPALPPRIELVYRGFLGTQGFFIGDAVYRLEHEGNRYSITTVAQARGLAALFIRGEGRLASIGTITRSGLQPDQYSAERTSDGRHEVATFDWDSRFVLLRDNVAALVMPTFDPLSVLWQFYFMPPEENQTEFDVATTRRVYHSRFRRVGTETLTLPFREVETEVWERDGGDGNITARVWLAPSLHHVMVKMRLSNGRITGEALLDSIRVDETVATQ